MMHDCVTEFAWRREKVVQGFAFLVVIKNVFFCLSRFSSECFFGHAESRGLAADCHRARRGKRVVSWELSPGPSRAKSFLVTLGHFFFVCAVCDLAGNIVAFIGKLESCEAPALAEVETVANGVFPWTIV